MDVQDENAYEDLLGQWSDLESGLGRHSGQPRAPAQQFAHRVLAVRPAGCKACCSATRTSGLYLLVPAGKQFARGL